MPLRFSLLLLTLIVAPIPSGAGASKPPDRARHGMVVSSHRLASEAGARILREGGNAVDAAIATGLALAVVLPGAGNIGGGGFMIVCTKDGKVTAFDFREKAPLTAHERMYIDSNGNYIDESSHEGYLAIGVPGTVAGFDLAHKRFGSKPWKELVEPALDLADDGFPVSWAMADDFTYYKNDFRKYPSSSKVFLKDDSLLYQEGEMWEQPDLYRTLKRIQKYGRDGFYKGETARLIAEDMKKHGGLISEADLAAYEAKVRTPIHGTYRGYDIYSMPPPSSGGTVLVEMLNILEGFDLASCGHNSGMYLHLLSESMRRAYADRARYLGDPDFNPGMPIEKLTSKEYAAELRKSISMEKKSPSDPVTFNDAYESPETTHYSVVDAEGNAVVVTYTIEYWYGTRIVADGLGFLYNNEMGDFNAVPGLTDTTGEIGTKPNLVAPGKRMLSSMTPTIVVKDGKPFFLIGSPGGKTIINTVMQCILNVIDFKMDVSEAVTAGRLHHQWLPDVLRIEKYGTTVDSQRILEAMGYRVRMGGQQGSAMGIIIDPVTGMKYGGVDPRQADAEAAGY